MNISVDEDVGLPVIIPVRQAAAGGGAEERKNQVFFKSPKTDLYCHVG